MFGDKAESSRFPGYVFHAGASMTTDAAGVVLLRALPIGFPHDVTCATKDRTRKASENGVRPVDGETPPEVVLRMR